MHKTQAMQRANDLCGAWLKAQVLEHELRQAAGGNRDALVQQAQALVEAIDTEIQYYQNKR